MVPKAVRNRVRLAQQRAAAEITAPMPRQKTCRLGGDHASLDAGQDRLGVSQRKADRLQSVSAFVEVQDCVFADHIVVVTNDPELDLEAHACPKGCHCGSARLSAADIPDQTPSPTFCHAPEDRPSHQSKAASKRASAARGSFHLLARLHWRGSLISGWTAA